MRPSQGFGEQGIYFRRTGEQRPNFEGNRGTIITILGDREHKKTHFRSGENRATSQPISGEQRNRYPLGGPQLQLLYLTIFNLAILNCRLFKKKIPK